METGAPVTPAQLARVLGFENARRIDQLVQDGIITPTLVKEKGKRDVRKYELEKVVPEYIRHIKARTDSKKGLGDADALADAELRYKRARAERMELELSEYKGMMHRSEDVMAAFDMLVEDVRARLLALPGQLAVDAAGATNAREASAVIKDGVAALLSGLSAYTYDGSAAPLMRRRVRGRTKWAQAGSGDADDAQAEEKKPAARKRKSKAE